MNNVSKLMLSDEEQQLVNNSGWILTKRIIIEKVCSLLGTWCEQQQALIKNEKTWLPPAVVRSEPKIARGENYLQLPYVLLDYPRCFDSENIFAVRTMFWWGNFFSITLLLSGSYRQLFQQKILNGLDQAVTGYYICIHENPWQHHFEADNYLPVQQLTKKELQETILQKEFIKLALKFPLAQWNNIPDLLDDAFNEMIEMLRD